MASYQDENPFSSSDGDERELHPSPGPDTHTRARTRGRAEADDGDTMEHDGSDTDGGSTEAEVPLARKQAARKRARYVHTGPPPPTSLSESAFSHTPSRAEVLAAMKGAIAYYKKQDTKLACFFCGKQLTAVGLQKHLEKPSCERATPRRAGGAEDGADNAAESRDVAGAAGAAAADAQEPPPPWTWEGPPPSDPEAALHVMKPVIRQLSKVKGAKLQCPLCEKALGAVGMQYHLEHASCRPQSKPTPSEEPARSEAPSLDWQGDKPTDAAAAFDAMLPKIRFYSNTPNAKLQCPLCDKRLGAAGMRFHLENAVCERRKKPADEGASTAARSTSIPAAKAEDTSVPELSVQEAAAVALQTATPDLDTAALVAIADARRRVNKSQEEIEAETKAEAAYATIRSEVLKAKNSKDLNSKFPCPLCGKLMGGAGLEYHLAKRVCISSRSPWTCPLCAAEFERLGHLKLHLESRKCAAGALSSVRIKLPPLFKPEQSPTSTVTSTAAVQPPSTLAPPTPVMAPTLPECRFTPLPAAAARAALVEAREHSWPAVQHAVEAAKSQLVSSAAASHSNEPDGRVRELATSAFKDAGIRMFSEWISPVLGACLHTPGPVWGLDVLPAKGFAGDAGDGAVAWIASSSHDPSRAEHSIYSVSSGAGDIRVWRVVRNPGHGAVTGLEVELALILRHNFDAATALRWHPAIRPSKANNCTGVLAAAFADGSVRLLGVPFVPVESGAPLALDAIVLAVHQRPCLPMCLAWHPHHAGSLVAGWVDGRVSVYNCAHALPAWACHGSSVHGAASTLRPSSLHPSAVLETNEDVAVSFASSCVRGVAVSPSSTSLVAAGYGSGRLVVWDLAHPREPILAHLFTTGITALAWVPHVDAIVVGLDNGDTVLFYVSRAETATFMAAPPSAPCPVWEVQSFALTTNQGLTMLLVAGPFGNAVMVPIVELKRESVEAADKPDLGLRDVLRAEIPAPEVDNVVSAVTSWPLRMADMRLLARSLSAPVLPPKGLATPIEEVLRTAASSWLMTTRCRGAFLDSTESSFITCVGCADGSMYVRLVDPASEFDGIQETRKRKPELARASRWFRQETAPAPTAAARPKKAAPVRRRKAARRESSDEDTAADSSTTTVESDSE